MICLALLSSGCTTVQTVPPSALVCLPSVVRVGDRVACTLADGSHLQFEVTAVEPAALVGGTRRVTFAEIVHLELRRFDACKTIGAFTVIAGAAALGVASAKKAENSIQIGIAGK